MSCRLNETVLSLVCFETVRVFRVMHAGSMAGHSRHTVQRLQNCVIHIYDCETECSFVYLILSRPYFDCEYGSS